METVQYRKSWTWISLIFSALLGAYLSACSGDRTSETANLTNSEPSERPKSEASAAPKTDQPYLNRLLPEAQRISKEFGLNSSAF